MENKNKITALNSNYIWERNFINTYDQPSFVIERGEGSCLYDTDGNKYIDFTSGFGASSLGYSHKTLKNEIKKQVDNILHTSNLYYNNQMLEAGIKLVKSSEMDKVYFCNSGTEANETAFKIARKYSSDKYGKNRGSIISLKNSFHGRTMVSLMATGMDRYHKYFYPMPEGHKYVEINNIEEFISEIDESVCAIIVESIQGEGGVNILEKEYIETVTGICKDKDIVVIFDEIQCGMGRTGKLFGFENFGVKADIITTAKGLGSGIPVGAVLTRSKFSNVLGKGDQGTTFGGNPLAMAASKVVLDELESPGFYTEVQKKGDFIKNYIENLNSNIVKEIKGIGLMIGISVSVSASSIAERARESGVLILTAGDDDVVRFLPPLNISYDEIKEGLEILKYCF